VIRVVVNSPPLIFPSKIRKLNLLRDYKVYVPNQVVKEVARGKRKNKEEVLLIEEFFEKENVTKKWVEIIPPPSRNSGEGEKAAISLAL